MRGALVFLLFISTLPGLPAAIPDEDRLEIEEALKEPVSVALTNGQTLSGHPIHVTADKVQLATSEGAGEVVFTLSREDIQSIEVPGEGYKQLAIEWMNRGELSEALELMDLLYGQRSGLLPMLPASESNFFILYIQLILQSPDPARSIGVSSRLRPQLENPAAIHALDDAILESYQILELFDEAVPLAEAWIREREPHSASALGYYVLGCHHLREADYETALDLALQPIVFSSLIPADKLGHCYAIAASAALELRGREYAALLYKEMKARGFIWPSEDSTLEPYYFKIIELVPDHDSNETPQPTDQPSDP